MYGEKSMLPRITFNKIQLLGVLLIVVVIGSIIGIGLSTPQINIIVDLYRGLSSSIISALHR